MSNASKLEGNQVKILYEDALGHETRLIRVWIQDRLDVQKKTGGTSVFISFDERTISDLIKTIKKERIDFSGKYLLFEFSEVLTENLFIGIQSGKIIAFSKSTMLEKQEKQYNPDIFCKALITRIFQDLVNGINAKDYNYLSSLLKVFAQHLTKIHKDNTMQPLTKIGLTPWQLRKMDEYIKTNLSNNITLQHLAEKLGLSPGYLCKKCKQTTGYTPMQYLTKIRMEKAVDFLRQTELPIIQAGMEVGIDNHSQFCRAFKKFYGFPPSQVRKDTFFES